MCVLISGNPNEITKPALECQGSEKGCSLMLQDLGGGGGGGGNESK